MSLAAKETSPAVLFQLAEAGFLASDMGLPDQAIAIFSGLALMQPSIPHPVINQAIVHARYGKMDQAIEVLRGLLEHFSESQMAKAMLGMFYAQQDDPRAITLLNEVLQENKDADAVSVARSCYDLAQKQETNRMPAPFTDELRFFRIAEGRS